MTASCPQASRFHFEWPVGSYWPLPGRGLHGSISNGQLVPIGRFLAAAFTVPFRMANCYQLAASWPQSSRFHFDWSVASNGRCLALGVTVFEHLVVKFYGMIEE
jgi:hypothetical protein